MPDTGKHGRVVRNAIDFLVKACPEDGYFGKVDGSRMYGHAITTLALAEVCGMEADPAQRQRVRAALNAGIEVPKESADRAAGFVLKCWQPEHKAFAYQPGGEVSLTMTAAAAL